MAELEDARFEVVQATTGRQALRPLQIDIAIDALLTDIRMPEANGWEVARAYRARPGPACPVRDRLCRADAAGHRWGHALEALYEEPDHRAPGCRR
jgi:CheY-like chemotaxis protein